MDEEHIKANGQTTNLAKCTLYIQWHGYSCVYTYARRLYQHTTLYIILF